MAAAKIQIDWGQFDAQCQMQCTLREIADYFNCSERTIERKVHEHFNCRFVDIFKRKRVKGLMSLRANLFKLSGEQASVAIFLAKNWLGMTDKHEVEVSDGPGRGLKELSDEELEALLIRERDRRTARKAKSP